MVAKEVLIQHTFATHILRRGFDNGQYGIGEDFRLTQLFLAVICRACALCGRRFNRLGLIRNVLLCAVGTRIVSLTYRCRPQTCNGHVGPTFPLKVDRHTHGQC